VSARVAARSAAGFAVVGDLAVTGQQRGTVSDQRSEQGSVGTSVRASRRPSDSVGEGLPAGLRHLVVLDHGAGAGPHTPGHHAVGPA
jgi:hypothetical protein